MALESYSVLAFSPCATAKKPAFRCHASSSRTTDDLECDFFMLELLLYHALRHWSFWGESTCIALQSCVHQQLAICCAYPWVSCERHRTAYTGPSEGTLRRYVRFAGSAGCILGASIELHLLFAMYSAYSVPSILASPLKINDHFLELFAPNRRPIPTQCRIVSLYSRNKKQGTVHTHHTLRNISVSPPTTPSPPTNHTHNALAKDTSIILQQQPFW
jgi:hypothetical protein